MKVSEKGLAIIKKYEGCRLTAYVCPAGKLTIGYGHTKGVKKGQKITQAQAEAYLREDVAGAEKAVNAIGKGFNQNQFDALVSFTYNCGSGNLKTLCKDRSVDQIGEKIILYNKANGKKLNGLVRRREEEQRLYKTPCATVQPVQAARDNTELPTIRRGSKGEAVRKLQQVLLAQKFKSCEINGKKKYLAADGDFGAITEKILRRWQSHKGLKVDGVCGPKTWASLGY